MARLSTLREALSVLTHSVRKGFLAVNASMASFESCRCIFITSSSSSSFWSLIEKAVPCSCSSNTSSSSR